MNLQRKKFQQTVVLLKNVQVVSEGESATEIPEEIGRLTECF